MKKTGDSYLDSEDFRAMLEDYEMMVKAGQPVFMDADDLTDIAEYYNCVGEQKKCDEVIEYARSIAPDAASPIEFLAHKAINEGDLDRARQLIDMVDDEDDPEYQYLKVEMCLAEGEIDKANTIANDYFSGVDEEDQNDFCFDLANLYTNYEWFKTAKGWFDMIEKEDTTEYLELQCRIAYGMNDYDLCISLIEKLLDKDPYSNKYWNVLSQAQIARGNVSDALTSSDYALAIDPNDVGSLFTKGMGLIGSDNRSEAIKYFKRALSLNPDAYDVLMQLTSIYVDEDDLLTALHYAQRAVEASREYDDASAEAYKSLILILASLKRPKEALAKVEEAERLGLVDLESDVFRGYIYLTCDKPQEANAAFKRAFDESLNITRTTLLVIMALQDNGYYDVAYELGKDFMDSDDGSFYFDQGCAYMTMICMHLNKEEETVAYFKKAVKRAPGLMTLLMSAYVPKDLSMDEYYNFLKNKAKKQQ